MFHKPRYSKETRFVSEGVCTESVPPLFTPLIVFDSEKEARKEILAFCLDAISDKMNTAYQDYFTVADQRRKRILFTFTGRQNIYKSYCFRIMTEKEARSFRAKKESNLLMLTSAAASSGNEDWLKAVGLFRHGARCPEG